MSQSVRFSWPLLLVIAFCLTSMTGCPNNVPAGQFTVVKGTVLNLRTGRPLPGIRMVLVSAPTSARIYGDGRDTVLTDAQGNYTLSFTNDKGLFYAVSCEGPFYLATYRLDFPDSVTQTGQVINLEDLRTRAVVIGRNNIASFQVSPRRVVQLQVLTRNTGYQELTFGLNSGYLPADNQRRTLYLYQPVAVTRQNPQAFYQLPTAPPVARFIRNRSTAAYQDTTVQAQASTPLTGDTVRASLQFGR